MIGRGRTKEEIKKNLLSIPINMGQIDINGLCNAQCWFCPVRYEGNPKEYVNQMTPNELASIFSNLQNSSLFPKTTRFLYTCHYNEVLLHKDFDDMMNVFRDFGFKTAILSNGTPLTPAKIDFIKANPDILTGIALNIPAIEKEDWMRKTGFEASVHKVLMRNLQYLNDNFNGASLQINSLLNGDRKLDKGIYTTHEQALAIKEQFLQLFPNIGVWIQEHLSDRAGSLTEHKVLLPYSVHSKQPVVGCNHSASSAGGGRVYEWVHIGPKGDLFLCCDDYKMQYNFGNLLDKPFDEIWASDEHIAQIQKAQDEICSRCNFAAKEL